MSLSRCINLLFLLTPPPPLLLYYYYYYYYYLLYLLLLLLSLSVIVRKLKTEKQEWEAKSKFADINAEQAIHHLEQVIHSFLCQTI